MVRRILPYLSIFVSFVACAHMEDYLSDRTCSDVTEQEITEIESLVQRLSGKFISPTSYGNSIDGLQQYLNDVGVSEEFSAKEMVTPNHPDKAEKCGYKYLVPPTCRWNSAAAQGMLASKISDHIGKKSNPDAIKIRNWWRPKCYNSKVGGASRSDHIQARGFDLDFETAEDRVKAQDYLCKLYKDNNFSLQVGIGCKVLHIGIGSPKRLSNFPADGARFWTYRSLYFNCPIKRLETDNCWRKAKDGSKYIFTEDPVPYSF